MLDRIGKVDTCCLRVFKLLHIDIEYFSYIEFLYSHLLVCYIYHKFYLEISNCIKTLKAFEFFFVKSHVCKNEKEKF